MRFSRLEQRGLLLGLSGEQVFLCGLALAAVVLAEYTAGIPGVIAAAPFWALTLAWALVPVRGRPVVEWLPIWAHYLTRRVRGGAQQRVVPTTRINPTDLGPQALRIPGGPTGLTLWTMPDTGRALVHDPGDGTVTGVLRVDSAGFLLADPGLRDGLVAGWGQLLAGLAHQPTVVRVQVLARTVPGGVGPLAGVVGHDPDDVGLGHPGGRGPDRPALGGRGAHRDPARGRGPPQAPGTRRLRRRRWCAAQQVLEGVADSVAAAGLTPRGLACTCWVAARGTGRVRPGQPGVGQPGPDRVTRGGRGPGRAVGPCAHRFRGSRRVLGGGVAPVRGRPRVPATRPPGWDCPANPVADDVPSADPAGDA